MRCRRLHFRDPGLIASGFPSGATLYHAPDPPAHRPAGASMRASRARVGASGSGGARAPCPAGPSRACAAGRRAPRGCARRTPRRRRRDSRSRRRRSGATIPPTAPPIVGRPFHSASDTVRPKPSANRLLDAHLRLHLEGVDLDRADVVQVREHVDVGVVLAVLLGLSSRTPSPRDRRGPSIRPARAGRRGARSLTSGRRRSRPSGPSRGRTATPAASAAGSTSMPN